MSTTPPANEDVREEAERPGDPRYRAVIGRQVNKRFRGSPDCIRQVESTEAVMAAVEEAVREERREVPTSGGHCLEGFVSAPELRVLVDLSPMKRVYHDAAMGAVAVEAGATVGEIFRALHDNWGVGMPLGEYPGIGIGGHVDVGGGAFGFPCRELGLAAAAPARGGGRHRRSRWSGPHRDGDAHVGPRYGNRGGDEADSRQVDPEDTCSYFFVATLLALVLGAGCQPLPASPMASAGVPLLPRLPGVAAPVTDFALPPVERARLEYALESARLLAQDWPWMVSDQTCVLLISPTVQWVLNCPTPPEKFREVGPALGGKPVYAHAGDTISIDGQAMPTAAFVRAVPAIANVALPGDSEKADVDKDGTWLVVSSLDALIGSHPAFNSRTTTEEWLSVFLHEFFHTRQLLVPSFRPTLVEMKSGKLDRATLERTFREDAGYRANLEREYHILSSAAARDGALTGEAARRALAEWVPAYLQRRAQLQRLGGDALVRADVAFTYVEGTARYAEAFFLRDPRFHAARSLQSDSHFEGYRAFSRPGYEGLVQRRMGASYFYALGMHLGLILDHIEPSWKNRVSEQADWIIGLAREAAAAAGPRPAGEP